MGYNQHIEYALNAKFRERAMIELGNVIRKARKERGLSQSELAKRAGVDRSYLSEVERGKRNITISMLMQLSETLGYEAVITFLELPKERDSV